MTAREKALFIIANEDRTPQFLGIKTGMSPRKVQDLYEQLFDKGLYRQLKAAAEPYRISMTGNRNTETFADRFRKLMEEPLKTKSIRAIAKEMGINEDAVPKYLKGVHIPREDKLMRIAEYFKVSPAWLLNEQE